MSGRRTPLPLSRLQIAVLALTATGAVLAALSGSRPGDGREGIFFTGHAAGDVLFDHTAHAVRSTECATCHHDLWAAASVDGCESCHGDDVDPDFLDHDDYVDLHESDCSFCHEKADDDEASSCRGCHPAAQTESQTTTGCEDCHDFDRDEAPLGHGDLIELHRDCGMCHAPRAIGRAYHDQCTACHVATDPTRFRNEDGSAACGWCHLQ